MAKKWLKHCEDSICNNPKLVLCSYVKGPNNKIIRAWTERLGLGHRTVVSHGTHSNLHEGELSISNESFPPARPKWLQSLDLVQETSCSYCSSLFQDSIAWGMISPLLFWLLPTLFILAFLLS